jgi:hypothetical protein
VDVLYINIWGNSSHPIAVVDPEILIREGRSGEGGPALKNSKTSRDFRYEILSFTIIT